MIPCSPLDELLAPLFPDRLSDADLADQLDCGHPGDLVVQTAIVCLGERVWPLRRLGYAAAALLFLAMGTWLDRGALGWAAALPLLAVGLGGAHRVPDLHSRRPTEAEKVARFVRVEALRRRLRTAGPDHAPA